MRTYNVQIKLTVAQEELFESMQGRHFEPIDRAALAEAQYIVDILDKLYYMGVLDRQRVVTREGEMYEYTKSEIGEALQKEIKMKSHNYGEETC